MPKAPKPQDEQETFSRTLYFEGDIEIEITYPESIAFEVDETINEYAKSGGVLFIEDFLGLDASMNGKHISHINMKKFIGMV